MTRMFALSYMLAELRRRRGRTLLTALGLGVGVGLVVCVAALSDGLDKAQDEILDPLTGVGTDLSVTRPVDVSGGPQNLSEKERAQLEQENGGGRVGLIGRAEPGESFSRHALPYSTSQLSFPAAEVDDIARLDGVAGAAGSLTLSATVYLGQGPRARRGRAADADPFQAAPGQAPPARPRNIAVDATTVTGIDLTEPDLAPVTPDQITFAVTT